MERKCEWDSSRGVYVETDAAGNEVNYFPDDRTDTDTVRNDGDPYTGNWRV